MPTKLTINGKAHTISSSPDTPLLWVLRDELGMTGTKFGCGRGFCGSCTVLANGEAIENAVYDLKAVNPNRTSQQDTRTPNELLAFLAEKGREADAALARLGELLTVVR